MIANIWYVASSRNRTDFLPNFQISYGQELASVQSAARRKAKGQTQKPGLLHLQTRKSGSSYNFCTCLGYFLRLLSPLKMYMPPSHSCSIHIFRLFLSQIFCLLSLSCQLKKCPPLSQLSGDFLQNHLSNIPLISNIFHFFLSLCSVLVFHLLLLQICLDIFQILTRDIRMYI